MKKTVLILLVLIFAFGCQEAKKETKADTATAEKVVKGPFDVAPESIPKDSLADKGSPGSEPVDSIKLKETAFRAKIDSVFADHRKVQQGRDSVIMKIVNDSTRNISLTNRQFLLQLLKNHDSTLSFQRPLGSIIRFPEKAPFVLSLKKWVKIEPKKYKEFYSEDWIRKKADTIPFNYRLDGSRDTVFTGAYDSVGISNRSIFVYGINFKNEVRVADFGLHWTECSEYYFSTIDTTSLKNTDRILISSTYDLDLEFGSYPKIDSIIQSNPIYQFYDCAHNYPDQVTYAQLKGTENIYFLYADTFPFNDQFDTPIRAVHYISETGTIIELWSEELDLFGCSCL